MRLEAAIEVGACGDKVCCEVLVEAVDNVGVVGSRAGADTEVWFEAEDKPDVVI